MENIKEVNQKNQNISLAQLLKITIDLLGGIKVPVHDTETVAVPISYAVKNLTLGIEAADFMQKKIEELSAELADGAPAEMVEVDPDEIPEDAEVVDLGEVEVPEN